MDQRQHFPCSCLSSTQVPACPSCQPCFCCLSRLQAQVCLVLINLVTLLLGVGLVYLGVVGKQAAKGAAGITSLALPGASPPDHVGVQVVHR